MYDRINLLDVVGIESWMGVLLQLSCALIGCSGGRSPSDWLVCCSTTSIHPYTVQIYSRSLHKMVKVILLSNNECTSTFFIIAFKSLSIHFQSTLNPLSIHFQTPFKPLSNNFQTTFKPLSNGYSNFTFVYWMSDVKVI